MVRILPIRTDAIVLYGNGPLVSLQIGRNVNFGLAILLPVFQCVRERF